ncbi:MAG: outer membrane protein [Campylobacterota bacterium]|nr:outer membrane protein [Campylobacterota bacterium]
MKKVILLLFLSIVFLKAEVLTLKECIDAALKNNPDVKSIAFKLEQSKEDTKREKASYLPKVDITLDYSPSKTFTVPTPKGIDTQNESATHADITLYQKIYDFDKTKSKVDIAKTNEELMQLSLKEAQNLLVLQIKQLYDVLILEKLSSRVAKNDLFIKEELYKEAKTFASLGMKTRADELRFYASLIEAKDELEKTKSSYTKNLLSLQRLSGLKIDENIGLEENLNKEKYKDKKSAIELLEKNNLLLISESKKIEKSISSFNEAKSADYPEISAYAYYSQEDGISSYDTNGIGIRAVIPLYNGGSVNAKKERAHLEMLVAKEEFSSKKLALAQELEALLVDAKRYDGTIEAKKIVAISAKEAYELMNARYKEGLATYLEVLDAAEFYSRSEFSYVRAVFEKNAIVNKIDYLLNSDEEYVR